MIAQLYIKNWGMEWKSDVIFLWSEYEERCCMWVDFNSYLPNILAMYRIGINLYKILYIFSSVKPYVSRTTLCVFGIIKSVSQGIKQRACPEFPESGSVLVGLQCQVSEWSLSNFVQNIPSSNFSRAVLYQFIQSSPVLNFSKPPCIEFFPE